MELLKTFEYKELRVETYYQGTDKLYNKTYIDGVLVYEDSTFRPSPMYNIDDPECIVALVDFLTMRDGDVEDNYFEVRGAPLLDNWANVEDYNNASQEIRMMIYDYQMKDDDGYLQDNQMTYEEVTIIENYIK